VGKVRATNPGPSVLNPESRLHKTQYPVFHNMSTLHVSTNVLFSAFRQISHNILYCTLKHLNNWDDLLTFICWFQALIAMIQNGSWNPM